VEHLLSEVAFYVPVGNWARLEMEVRGNSLRAFADRGNVSAEVVAVDNTYVDGGVIFGANNTEGGQTPRTYMDNILVQTTIPPIADANGPYTANEGTPILFDASGSSDPDGDLLQYRWDFESDGEWDTSWSSDSTASYTWSDDWNGEATVEVSDSESPEEDATTSTDVAGVTVNNVAPVVDPITAPVDPVQLGTGITVSADFTDPGTDYTHTAVWNWGDGTPATTINMELGYRSVDGVHTYEAAGVYTVTLTVTDDDGGSGDSTFRYVVVYDSEGGFVTGGGWIDSPEGAYAADPSLTGKANFGFVSKYKKGATTPEGNTEFVLRVADLNFHSASYDWLVIARHKAMYKGVGAINGEGNYGFMLSAIDEALTPSTDADLFRIKIWDKDNGDAVVYDNLMDADDDADPTTEIGGGSIVIHRSGPAAPELLPDNISAMLPFPQPANPEVWIPYQLGSDSQVTIRIYDMRGRLVRTLDLGHKPMGFYTTRDKAAHWNGRNEVGEQIASGIYFYNIQAGDFAATRKMVVKK